MAKVVDFKKNNKPTKPSNQPPSYFKALEQIARLEGACHELSLRVRELLEFQRFVTSSGWLHPLFAQRYKAMHADGKTPTAEENAAFDADLRKHADEWMAATVQEAKPAEEVAAEPEADAPATEAPDA